jgi:hypothetical protein
MYEEHVTRDTTRYSLGFVEMKPGGIEKEEEAEGKGKMRLPSITDGPGFYRTSLCIP